MSLFPGAIASFLGFTSGDTLKNDQHGAQHNSEQAEIIAAQTKIGTGSSTPASGLLLRGNGAGTSAWGQVILTSDVSGVLPVANGGLGQASLTNVPLVSPAVTGTVSGGATYSSPILTTPTIADFTNAIHTHANNAGGGTLGATALTTDSSWAWVSWTPTVTFTGGGSNGNATISGRYTQIGKTVHFRFSYIIGNTTSFTGMTQMIVTLPVTISSSFLTGTSEAVYGVGNARIFTTGAFPLGTYYNNTTTFRPVSVNASGTPASYSDITTTTPATWAINDYLSVVGTYEAA